MDYKKLKAPKNIKKIQKILKNANAFIVVSAEYNHMPPPALINIFNFFIQSLIENLPVFAPIQVATLLEVRVQSPLRAMLSQLGCPPIKIWYVST